MRKSEVKTAKPFIAVVGGRDAGKSTIIQSLTGAKSRQFRGTVTDVASHQTIEVIGSSPQERDLPLTNLRQIMMRAIASSVCRGLVCALQPNHPTKRLSMETVLQEALAVGFSVHVYVLDPERSGRSGSTAGIAARAPKGVKLRHLDARRFAQINAAIINRQTAIAA